MQRLQRLLLHTPFYLLRFLQLLLLSFTGWIVVQHTTFRNSSPPNPSTSTSTSSFSPFFLHFFSVSPNSDIRALSLIPSLHCYPIHPALFITSNLLLPPFLSLVHDCAIQPPYSSLLTPLLFKFHGFSVYVFFFFTSATTWLSIPHAPCIIYIVFLSYTHILSIDRQPLSTTLHLFFLYLSFVCACAS